MSSSRTKLSPIACPVVVGNFTAYQDVSSISAAIRCALDSTATSGSAVALFSCDDPTIGAGSIAGTFSPTNPATWPLAGLGVRLLGSSAIVGGANKLGSSPLTFLDVSDPTLWGPGLLILRTLGTAAVNLNVSGLGSGAGGSSAGGPLSPLTVTALASQAGGGVLGTSAALTVDTYRAATINQTTAAQTFTLANPTNAVAVQTFTVINVGTAPMIIYESVIQPGTAQMFDWDGSAWRAQGGSAATNDGNKFGRDLVLGTNDDFQVKIKTNGDGGFLMDTSQRVVIGNGSIVPSAALALSSAGNNMGFAPPRITTGQKNAIVAPVAGLMVYDTTLNKLCVYTGATWETVTSV